MDIVPPKEGRLGDLSGADAEPVARGGSEVSMCCSPVEYLDICVLYPLLLPTPNQVLSTSHLVVEAASQSHICGRYISCT